MVANRTEAPFCGYPSRRYCISSPVCIRQRFTLTYEQDECFSTVKELIDETFKHGVYSG
jgi:hypothetical protein